MAALPGALAARRDGRLIAVTASAVLQSGPGGAHWTTLVTLRALAVSAAGRACGLTALTAVTVGPSGVPLLGGDCRSGAAGIFRPDPHGWRLAARLRPSSEGPAVVVQMTRIPGVGTTVLVAAGLGRHRRFGEETLLPGRPWLAGDPLSVHGRHAVTATFVTTAGGWGAVAGGRSASYTAPAGPRQRPLTEWFNNFVRLPGPDASAALPPPLAELPTAFVPGITSIAVWGEGKYGGWRRAQVIAVPDQ